MSKLVEVDYAKVEARVMEYYMQHSPERFAPVVIIEAGAFRPAVIIGGTAFALPETCSTEHNARLLAEAAYENAKGAAERYLSGLGYRRGQLPRGGRYLPTWPDKWVPYRL